MDAELVFKFLDGTGPGPQGGFKYRFFFDSDEWRKSRWNKSVISNIAGNVLEKAQQRNLEPLLSIEVIEACILVHAEQVYTSWRQVILRVGEDQIDAHRRANQQQADDEERKRLYARKDEVSHSNFPALQKC
jgi:hypothetical protein